MRREKKSNFDEKFLLIEDLHLQSTESVQTKEKSSPNKKSACDESIIDNRKQSDSVDSKYAKKMKKIQKEYKRLKKNFDELEYEKLLKLDAITQLEGELEMKDDFYLQKMKALEQSLEIERRISKRLREEAYHEKLAISEKAAHLEYHCQLLQTSNEQLKCEQARLRDSLSAEYGNFLRKLICEDEKENSHLIAEILKRKGEKKRAHLSMARVAEVSILEERLTENKAVQTDFPANSLIDVLAETVHPDESDQCLSDCFYPMHQKHIKKKSTVRRYERLEEDKENFPDNMHNMRPALEEKEKKKKPNPQPSTLELSSLFSPENFELISTYLGCRKVKLVGVSQGTLVKDFWRPDRLYVCEATIKGQDIKDKILFWHTGLISTQLGKGMRMKSIRRVIEDKFMLILGNCEIRVEGNRIECSREGKKNFFEGDLPDHQWEIAKVSAYEVN